MFNNKNQSSFPHLILIFFIFLIIIITHSHYGIAWDENRFLSTGKYHLIKLFNAMGMQSNLADDTDKYYYFDVSIQTKSHGVLYDIAVIAITLFFKNITFETFHLIRGLLSIPAFILTGYAAYMLLGRRAAFYALLFLLVSPRFFGNLTISAIDIPTAIFFSGVIAYFLFYLRKPWRGRYSVGLALMMALLINQRLIMAYVFGVSVFVLFVRELLRQKKGWRQFLIHNTIIILGTLFFMHLTNPHLLTHPLTGLYEMVKLNAQFPFNATVLFDGAMIHASLLPWYYLPKYILITTPLFMVILFFIGVFRLLRIIKREKNTDQRIFALYVLLLFFSPIIINWIVRPVLYDAWRFFLFLTVPMVIIAVYGLEYLWNIRRSFVRKVATAIIAVGIISTTASMITLHPYEYAYFNSLVGGLKGADGRYETDYWALGNKEAMDWFNENINDPSQKYTIMAEGDPFSVSYYFKKNTRLTYSISEADYYITFTRWNKHVNVPGHVVYIVSRKNTPLVFVYKIDK